MVRDREEVKQLINNLENQYDISEEELDSENNNPKQTVPKPKSVPKPQVRRQNTRDPLKKTRGISDVGVVESNPKVTTGSLFGRSPIIGKNPVIGRRGMMEISDRIFGRKRRR